MKKWGNLPTYFLLNERIGVARGEGFVVLVVIHQNSILSYLFCRRSLTASAAVRGPPNPLDCLNRSNFTEFQFLSLVTAIGLSQSGDGTMNNEQ